MSTIKRTLKDAAVYINATSFVGMAKAIDLPTIERTTTPHETLAMIGTTNIGTGMEPMEVRIEWEGTSKERARLAYNLRDSVDLMVRGVIEDHSGPRVTRQSIVWYGKGIFRSTQGGNFSAKALSTSESVIDLSSYREEIDGAPMIEVDFDNNIYKVGGTDLNGQSNRMLGLV